MYNLRNSNITVKKLIRRGLSLLVVGVFLVNTLLFDIAIAQPSVSTLAPLAASENPKVKREITASMYRASRLIWLANSPRYLDLLARYNAFALLLPSGRYLMAPETAANDLTLIRSAIHEDNEILMQQEEKLRAKRYNRLMRQILGRDDIMKLYRALSHYKEPDKQPNNIIFNDLIAKAFEILLIIDDRIVYQKTELTNEEREFAALMRPILQAKDSKGRYKNFPQIFFDADKRTKAIRALQENKDERFYRVASADGIQALIDQIRATIFSDENIQQFRQCKIYSHPNLDPVLVKELTDNVIPEGPRRGVYLRNTALRGYRLAEARLKGLVTPFIITSIDVKIKSETGIISHRIEDAIVFPERVGHNDLRDSIRELAKGKKIEQIKDLVLRAILLDHAIMSRGVFLPDCTFENFGITKEGNIVLVDPGFIVADASADDFYLRGKAHYINNEFLNTLSQLGLSVEEVREIKVSYLKACDVWLSQFDDDVFAFFEQTIKSERYYVVGEEDYYQFFHSDEPDIAADPALIRIDLNKFLSESIWGALEETEQAIIVRRIQAAQRKAGKRYPEAVYIDDFIPRTQITGNIIKILGRGNLRKENNDLPTPYSINNIRQAFSTLDSETRKASQLISPVSRLRGTSQKLMDINKLIFCLPIDVLRNSPDIALALNSTGLLKKKPQDAGNIEFELIVTGVTKEDVKLIDGLNRDDIKKALNLSKRFTVSIITEAQIQETAQRFGYDVSNPKHRVAIVKDFFSGALAKGEYMAIATDALDTTEKADVLKEELERDLKAELTEENISIRVLVRPESGKSVYSLSNIINDWLEAIDQGNFSTISRILPIPAPLTPELERAIKAAWAILTAA